MEPKNIVCDVSAATFWTKTNFENHHQKEHGGTMYNCLDCDKEFVTKKSLYQHQKDVHFHSLKCECCDKFFSKKSNLVRHLMRIENEPVRQETPKIPENFPHCNKLFSSHQSAATHVKNVHGEMSSCSICNKKFTQKNNREVPLSLLRTSS